MTSKAPVDGGFSSMESGGAGGAGGSDRTADVPYMVR
jgi:hypothetical protein